MSSPTVSVITPLYNSAPFLSSTIKSVVDQTIGDWEMILADDCSTDGSLDIARAYSNGDPRIRLLRLSENSGPAAARNLAVEAARGRYIAFLDSDDQWLPGKLEKQLAFMEREGVSFTHTYYEMITESGQSTGKVLRAPSELAYVDMLKSNQIGCLTVMYDTAVLGKVYMPLIRKRQDYGLWLAILKKVPRAYCLPETLALYRQRTGSVSSNKVELLSYNWRLFRQVEGLSAWRSLYYLGWNVFRKFRNNLVRLQIL